MPWRTAVTSIEVLPMGNTLFKIILGFCAAAFAISSTFAEVPPLPTLAISNVTLIDGTGGAPRTHMTVRIENGRIADVVRTSGKRTDVDVEIDGSGRYLVPGFFDNNAHLTVYGQPSRREMTFATSFATSTSARTTRHSIPSRSITL
jgi:hypothetical protein